MLSFRKTILRKNGMRNKNQEQPHMTIRSWWVWLTTVGAFEVSTRCNEGGDFCTFVTGQKKKEADCSESDLR